MKLVYFTTRKSFVDDFINLKLKVSQTKRLSTRGFLLFGLFFSINKELYYVRIINIACI